MQRGFIGIDPGLSGAVAVLAHDGYLVTVYDTPVTVVGKTKRDYLLADMASLIALRHESHRPACVGIEAVHAMPGQGVTSMFSMGRGLGLWQGIIVSHKLPFISIQPVVWKRHFGLIGKPKGASLALAQQRWPQADLTLKRHEGRAEAMLIAEYTRLTHGAGSQKGVTDGDRAET